MADTKKTDSTGTSTGSSTFASTDAAVNDSASLPLSDRAPLASESSDPAVHQLLARRDALNMHESQGVAAAEDLAHQRKLWQSEHDEIAAALADLGYKA